MDRADLDDIEFRRVLGAPFANGRKLRDALEVIVNGARLSELLDGAPVDVVVGAIARTFRFDAAEMARSLQVVLAERR